jgi:Bifunctional DNA primase/polymerase, N-terminal
VNVKELRELLGHDVLLLAWPTGSKGTKRKWGHLTIADMEKPDYLANLERGNIGVALGVKSGNLIALDVDDDSLVEPYLALNPWLKDTLQTRGRRGRVFWLRMAGDYPAKTKPLETLSGGDAGEWRAGKNCQSIIHGIHPSGKAYEVVKLAKPLVVDFSSIVWPKEISNPPTLDSQLKKANWTEVAEVTDATEEAVEANVMRALAAPVFTLINSVEAAIERCMPTKVHENNLRLFDLARALLTLNQQAIQYDADEVFALWHQKAKPFLRPELSKEDYYLEFLKACHRAKVPLGSVKVAGAWERAKQNLLPLPPKVMALNKPDFQLLCAFFREMQVDAGDGNEWFVAGGYRACAKLLGHKNHSTVETWIGALHRMKVLETVKKGDARHCTRYRFKLSTTAAP